MVNFGLFDFLLRWRARAAGLQTDTRGASRALGTLEIPTGDSGESDLADTQSKRLLGNSNRNDFGYGSARRRRSRWREAMGRVLWRRTSPISAAQTGRRCL